MRKVPVIDIHAHFYPEPYLRLLAEEGERLGVRLRRQSRGGLVFEMRDGVLGPIQPAFTDLDLRLKEMNRQRVDVHALSLTRPMVYWAEGSLGLKLAQATNDAIAEAHQAFPDRFVGFATLPMQEPDLALQELDRAARLPGIRGVYLGTNVNGRDLSHADFLPLFQRIEELRLPVFLHPLHVIGRERLKPYFLYNLLGFPFDTAVAAVFSGLLDRFPGLTACLPHAGGSFPYLVGRMNRGHKIHPDCKQIEHRPSTYLRRFTYDTISHDPLALLYLIRLVGPDRVMLGSDFCFEIGYDRPVQVVTRLAPLSSSDQRRILGGNASRLLGLG
ncbi:MAG: amidohydrolase [Deltaproteobacteria bacterium]|nr:amidohydrolase [Deltaproteobacteria bacterium]